MLKMIQLKVGSKHHKLSTLFVMAAMVMTSLWIAPTTIWAQTPPPASGDWTIADTTLMYNETIDLNGNLIVQDGGSLTLEGVTLKMNCSYDGEYRIEVQDGGALYIANSIITAYDTNYEYLFWVKDGGRLEMFASELHECGYTWGTNGNQSGLCIESDYVTIRECLISDNWVGVYSHNATPTISGCTITTNRYGLYYHYSKAV